MRRTSSSFLLALACAGLAVVLAVLGTGLVVSRQSSEQAALDRSLATTAGEKAALVDTEIERVRALTLLTARIPPFAELYADAGSQAAAIAAVAGPGREIDEALAYLWMLDPQRIVAAGYIDVSGRENARVVRGVPTPSKSLLQNVASWPDFDQGVHTSVGETRISAPYMSPTAGVQVVSATTAVEVDGKVRAYVELQLATTAIGQVLTSDLPGHTGAAVVDDAGARVIGPGAIQVSGRPVSGLGNMGHLRYAVHQVPQVAGSGGPWYVVTSAPSRSAWSLAMAPTQSGVLAVALLLFVAAGVFLRRARAAHAAELAAEQRARDEAEVRSRIDSLTGLFNRRHATETIEHELARAGRTDASVGVLMFDIDRFKRVNDSQGHAGGDAVIIEVARRLKAGVREWDVVARIGGEEFCVILPGVESEEVVEELGNRLRAAVSERPIAVPRGVALPVTVSVGAAVFSHGEVTAEAAIDRADRALYAAKRRGRDRLCSFSRLDEVDLRAEQPECLQIAEALAVSADLREGDTELRSRRVAELAGEIAGQLGLSEDAVLRVRLAGWLRNVGKVAIPESVLKKSGPLSDEEWELVRTHPVVGEELLRNLPELSPAGPAVRSRHERYDGTGYPDRLAGEDIPLEARIVAATDAFVAMTTERSHSGRRTTAEAIAELRHGAGTQFDPRIVDLLVQSVLVPAGTDRASR